MLFRQFLNESVAAASYLVGCTASGEAVVIDPSLPAEQYALFAADKGLRVTAVLETHMHADYFSTGRALARLTGAQLYLPALAEARFDHTPVADGFRLMVGKVCVDALHTPGHTPEHMCYTITDTARATQPWFVLTGDCLFVGDVGRADLVDLPLTGPDYLYDSIFGRLLRLADEVEVYPGHYGGSACGGKAMSGKVASTIGFERRFNAMLQANTRAAFANLVSDTARATVEDVLRHRNTNRGELPLPLNYYASAEASLVADMPAVTASEAYAQVVLGAALIDLRRLPGFVQGHLQGALSLPYNRQNLEKWLVALTAPDEPLIVFGDQPFVARYAANLLHELGRNKVLGYVDAGLGAWQEADLPINTLPTLTVDALHQQVLAGTTTVLDVREPFEWAKGVIKGARLISFGAVREQLDTLRPAQPLVVICESGARAGAVASLLRRAGLSEVASVTPDGMSEYARRYPLQLSCYTSNQ